MHLKHTYSIIFIKWSEHIVLHGNRQRLFMSMNIKFELIKISYELIHMIILGTLYI